MKVRSYIKRLNAIFLNKHPVFRLLLKLSKQSIPSHQLPIMRTQRNNYGDSIVSGEEKITNQDEKKDNEIETEVDDVSLEQQELQLEQREEQLAIK